MAAIAWSNVSVSTVIGKSGLQWHKTGAPVKLAFSISKAPLIFAELPTHTFSADLGEWLDHLGVAIDELSVKIGKT